MCEEFGTDNDTIMVLFARLLCETQESLSPASLEALGIPPSLPDNRNNLASLGTPTQWSSQSTPLSHLPSGVFAITDLSPVNATNLREQAATGKQPSSWTDTQHASRPSALSAVSILNQLSGIFSLFLSSHSGILIFPGHLHLLLWCLIS